MTRALGRLSFLLLFHLTMVASGYACANPSMAMGHESHEGHGKHHQTPSAPERCAAPASCAPVMEVAARIVAAPVVGDSAVVPAFDGMPAVLDRAAPDTPPPRV